MLNFGFHLLETELIFARHLKGCLLPCLVARQLDQVFIAVLELTYLVFEFFYATRSLD